MASRTSQACDACRVRKVRCNGVNPCSQCAHLNLSCIFSPPPTKRKPGVRGRLVAQLRDKTTPGRSSQMPASTGTAAAIMKSDTLNYGTEFQLNSPLSESSTEYAPEFFFGLLLDFEDVVYPMNPIISPAEIRTAISNMCYSHEDTALVYAFAAVTINLTRTSWALHGDIAAQMTDLMQRCLVSHRRIEFNTITITKDGTLSEMPVSIKRIMTCIFLEISIMGFKRIERSFFILREAISLIQSLNIHLHSGEGMGSQLKHVACYQRLYWEAFIHERFMTIISGHPSILPPLATGFPFADSSVPSHVDLGFNRLIRLFCIMDDAFLTYWNAQQDATQPLPEMTAKWIESKQAQLDLDETETAEAERALRESGQGGLTELQHADLFVTRLWLRTLVWQLALSQGLLRSAPAENTHEGLSLHFPAQRLSAQLRSLVCRLGSVASIATHGSGILQKLFEITSTIADVLALPQSHGQSQGDAQTRMTDFVFLVKFLFSFVRTEKEQRDYLREKLEVLQPLYTTVDFGAVAGESPN
ncbi:Fc.00g055400.m01.CDS01 [Cosmosporella sp. VM-42]